MPPSGRRRRDDGFSTFGFRKAGVSKRRRRQPRAEKVEAPEREGGPLEGDQGEKATSVTPRASEEPIYMEDDRRVVDKPRKKRDEDSEALKTSKTQYSGVEGDIFTFSHEKTRKEDAREPGDDEVVFAGDHGGARGEGDTPGGEEADGASPDEGVYLPPDEEELTTDELLSRLDVVEEVSWDDPSAIPETEGAKAEGGHKMEEGVDDGEVGGGMPSGELGGEEENGGSGSETAGMGGAVSGAGESPKTTDGVVEIDWDEEDEEGGGGPPQGEGEELEGFDRPDEGPGEVAGEEEVSPEPSRGVEEAGDISKVAMDVVVADEVEVASAEEVEMSVADEAGEALVEEEEGAPAEDEALQGGEEGEGVVMDLDMGGDIEVDTDDVEDDDDEGYEEVWSDGSGSGLEPPDTGGDEMGDGAVETVPVSHDKGVEEDVAVDVAREDSPAPSKSRAGPRRAERRTRSGKEMASESVRKRSKKESKRDRPDRGVKKVLKDGERRKTEGRERPSRSETGRAPREQRRRREEMERGGKGVKKKSPARGDRARWKEAERGAVRERRGAEKERRGAVRERRGAEKERRGAERKKRGAEREKRGAEREKRGAEREKRGAVREKRGAEKERRGAERERRRGAGPSRKPGKTREERELERRKKRAGRGEKGARRPRSDDGPGSRGGKKRTRSNGDRPARPGGTSEKRVRRKSSKEGRHGERRGSGAERRKTPAPGPGAGGKGEGGAEWGGTGGKTRRKAGKKALGEGGEGHGRSAERRGSGSLFQKKKKQGG